MIVNDQGVGDHVQDLLADQIRQTMKPLFAASQQVIRMRSDIAAIGPYVSQAHADTVTATSAAHRVAAIITPNVSAAIGRFSSLPGQRTVADIGAQIARRYAFPALSFLPRFDPFGPISESLLPHRVQLVGHPSTPDEILDILERLAKQRVLPRLRGLTRRASRVLLDVYDAIRVRAQEAVETHVGPASVRDATGWFTQLVTDSLTATAVLTACDPVSPQA